MDASRYSSQQLPMHFSSEDFIAGYQPTGPNQMSVVRRFFCLFVTFDLIFVTLIFIICIVLGGETDIYKAFHDQIMNFTFYTSLFDVVAVGFVRFCLLILFYGIVQIDHWCIVALTTTSSCGFLIAKVFYYAWPISPQTESQSTAFQVFLIIISFVISWFEAWFLDSRVIPQENYSRSLMSYAINASMRESTPLLAPFLQSLSRDFRQPESIRQSFYSPLGSADNSDDEDEDLKQLGVDTVVKAYELLESCAWKTEKVTASNDIIYTMESRSLGKVYKLRAKVNYPAAKLLHELFYKIEDFPKWNPTLLESKIVKKIDSNTDIAYSVSTSGGGGIVKSRDFVNLRCWKLMNDSRVIDDFNIDAAMAESCDELVSLTDVDPSSEAADENQDCELPDDQQSYDQMKNVFVSAAMSIDYALMPPTTKYIRGDNRISCWACRPVKGEDSSCYFEWLLCIDLKGSLPKYVLNIAYNQLIIDYMRHLRLRIQTLNDKDKTDLMS